MHLGKIHREQLLSSVLLFNNTVFPLNSSHPVYISSCTTHLGQLFSVAFLHVSELIMLNPMALLRRLKILPLKKKREMQRCKVELDIHTLFL